MFRSRPISFQSPIKTEGGHAKTANERECGILFFNVGCTAAVLHSFLLLSSVLWRVCFGRCIDWFDDLVIDPLLMMLMGSKQIDSPWAGVLGIKVLSIWWVYLHTCDAIIFLLSSERRLCCIVYILSVMMLCGIRTVGFWWWWLVGAFHAYYFYYNTCWL